MVLLSRAWGEQDTRELPHCVTWQSDAPAHHLLPGTGPPPRVRPAQVPQGHSHEAMREHHAHLLPAPLEGESDQTIDLRGAFRQH